MQNECLLSVMVFLFAPQQGRTRWRVIRHGLKYTTVLPIVRNNHAKTSTIRVNPYA